ncbi:AAA family ATPase [Pseudomonas sp. UBA2684]|uniref:AAA family ATPase n=1 Tax=Pseudomonas sp. UBA2684 TaxID=1947311 RepID=UPI0025E0F472|nr:AAA family ATPase [Pseudomonas sp. UBA2684]|tara:strand:+ start:6872 stop:8962 length:2091 start_codon:yes stop_codon:yes gene_type:complete
MKIEINNCNNIEQGQITIAEHLLNIKYAINGTGKSTVSKAIQKSIASRISGKNELLALKPFKAVNDDNALPSVVGCETIGSVKVFDESYINDFTYQPDELLKGSFDILIRDENYDSVMAEIEELVSQIKNHFNEDKDIEALISDFDELSNSFGKPTKTGVHGSSAIAKAFKGGNKVTNIPEGLEAYQHFIQGVNNVKWVKWQLDGGQFIEGSDSCPYCVGDVKDTKETIKRVGDVYDSKSIENLNNLVQIFQRLEKYFSDQTREIISEFVSSVDGYSEEQVGYLLEVKDQVDRFNGRFKQLKNIGFFTFKDVEKVIDELRKYTVDSNLYSHLQSEEALAKIANVNKSIENLIAKAGKLQGRITVQKKYIERVVQDNKSNINTFLRNAGYRYTVDLIEDDAGKHRLKLTHSDLDSAEVPGVRNVLSYGERNAFALVLFMFDALKTSPDLIVLDDPISSFDKNKKYAIIEMLFRKEKSFRGKTVLLLSHDFEPIVDMLYHHSDRFEKPHASFLQNNNGQLQEVKIEKCDIMTFVDINSSNITSGASLVAKLVYLRRTYEILNSKGVAYQLVSNVFHRRQVPLIFENSTSREMTPAEINQAETEIKLRISEFDYSNVIQLILDTPAMIELYQSCGNNYEKLHIYRIISEGADHADVVLKFINQAFHIENDYIYQLNPAKYQTVPQYVIDECDQYVATLR